jgi:hypothetical protein
MPQPAVAARRKLWTLPDNLRTIDDMLAATLRPSRDPFRFRRELIVATCLAIALASSSAALAQTDAFNDADSDEQHDIKGAIADSLRMLTTQHVLRVTLEKKTRRELGGPFFADYARSAGLPEQWGDGDSILTNYVGHPIQGAASGFIWLRHDSRAPATFRLDSAYLKSRVRGMVFAAGYSAQFELGPLSEASIGNVGMRPHTAGWVDHVITPAGGLALMVGEDFVDRFVVRRLEARVKSPVVRALARMLLNPARSTANFAALEAPWQRPDRPLRDGGSITGP